MVVNRQATMYSEIYGILNMLGNVSTGIVSSILCAKQILNLIEDKRFKDYTPKYNVSIPLWKQNISKGATEFICMLHYNYWIKSEDEKNEIDNILTNNQKKKDEYLKVKYNPDDIFKNRNVNNNDITQNVQEKLNEEYNKNLPMEVQKQNIFRRLLGFIKDLLHIK